MNWDHVRGCFQFNVQLGSDSFESFQLLLNGRWETCLYPDRPCSSCHSNVVILGPDAGGGDFCWTMDYIIWTKGSPARAAKSGFSLVRATKSRRSIGSCCQKTVNNTKWRKRPCPELLSEICQQLKVS